MSGICYWSNEMPASFDIRGFLWHTLVNLGEGEAPVAHNALTINRSIEFLRTV